MITENYIRIQYNSSSGRRTALYFGDLPYPYGDIHHIKPCPYPKCEVFDTIFSEIQPVVPDFTRSNYMCLVNLYRGGNAFIPVVCSRWHGKISLSLLLTANFFPIPAFLPKAKKLGCGFEIRRMGWGLGSREGLGY